MVCQPSNDYLPWHTEVTSRGRQAQVRSAGMGRCYRFCCCCRDSDQMADYGGLHHSDSLNGEFIIGRRLSLCEQVPLSNTNSEDTDPDASDPPENLVHRYSFLC